MGKRKFTAEQAREALLVAGIDMLERIGPAGVATVSLAEAITRSGVPRPSAYRVFGGGDLDPQREFQEQLVLRVIEMEPGLKPDVLIEGVAPILARADGLVDPLSSEELTELLVELLKASAGTSIDFMLRDSAFGVYLSAMALVRTSDSPRVEAAIDEIRSKATARWETMYRELLSVFGLRLRSGWTSVELYKVFNDATLGAVLAARASRDPKVPASTSAVLATTYIALVAIAAEPDPRRVVSAQPMTMLSTSPNQLVEAV